MVALPVWPLARPNLPRLNSWLWRIGTLSNCVVTKGLQGRSGFHKLSRFGAKFVAPNPSNPAGLVLNLSFLTLHH